MAVVLPQQGAAGTVVVEPWLGPNIGTTPRPAERTSRCANRVGGSVQPAHVYCLCGGLLLESKLQRSVPSMPDNCRNGGMCRALHAYLAVIEAKQRHDAVVCSSLRHDYAPFPMPVKHFRRLRTESGVNAVPTRPDRRGES